MRKIIKYISILALFLSAGWFVFSPGFEPVITFLFGLIGLLGSWQSSGNGPSFDKQEEVFVKVTKAIENGKLISKSTPIQPETSFSVKHDFTTKLELAKIEFFRLLRKPVLKSIESNTKLKNLFNGQGVYDYFLKKLSDNGWIRFAAGFKAGIYGHQQHKWCIKVLGMGVGNNPSFFCGHGYYLEHERNMLIDFKKAGFNFQPSVMTKEETIDFLMKECGVDENHAASLSGNNNILIIEYFPGIPLVTQTGHHLYCEINPCIMNDQVLKVIGGALDFLKIQLQEANSKGLHHNDPIAFNILFVLNEKDRVIAKLVDFELAQNFNKVSPEHVNISVRQLYQQRNVPNTKNLDQHLLDESIRIVEQLSVKVNNLKHPESPFDSISSLHGPFPSGINVDLSNVTEYLVETL
jgi:hypothetical protein